MGFLTPTDFRWILPQETDANSPVSEELMSQYRENIEAVQMGITFTGKRAVVTNNGGGTNVLTVDKGTLYAGYPDFGTGSLVGLILDITSGTARGNRYIITANTAMVGTGTGTITGEVGDNFNNDGILVNDTIMVSYIIDTMGHTHDGVNSSPLAVQTLSAYGGLNSLGGLTLNTTPTIVMGSFIDTDLVSFTFQSGMRELHFDLNMTIGANSVTRLYEAAIYFPTQTVYTPGGGAKHTITANAYSPWIPYQITNGVGTPMDGLSFATDSFTGMDITTYSLVPQAIYEAQLVLRVDTSITLSSVTRDIGRIYTS